MAAIYAVVDGTWTPRYVGMTMATPTQRFRGHVREIERDDQHTRHLPFRRWLTKHLDEAQVVEIESGDWTRAELCRREQEWIGYFGLETLLNVTEGGDGGWGGRVGTREQALKAWETRRVRGTDTWTIPVERRTYGRRSPSSEWRKAHPEWEQARVASVMAANKRRDHRTAERVVIQCKCGCGTEIERTVREVERGRRYVNRAHYLGHHRN